MELKIRSQANASLKLSEGQIEVHTTAFEGNNISNSIPKLY